MPMPLISFVLPVLLVATIKTVDVSCFFVARYCYQYISFLDPDGVYLVVTIHHIAQAGVGLLLINLYARANGLGFADFGFRKALFTRSIKPILVFVSGWGAFQLIFTMVYVYALRRPLYNGYRFTVLNETADFLFQITLSGTSEEILFRAMILTIVLRYANRRTKSRVPAAIAATAISTLIFMFDHVNFDLVPFRVTHLDIYQQLTCLVFSIFYSWLFMRYKSVYSVMLAHNLLNGLITIIVLFIFMTWPIRLFAPG